MSETAELTKLEDKAGQLDAVSVKYSNALSKDSTPFSSALILSQGIQALRDLLDDGIMREIMNLADTPLGFLTDKKGVYKSSEIKDAIIEASLRGFRVAGNEFNVISGRFYAAKAGLHRKVITFEGLTDFTETFSVPRFTADKSGAVVTAKATWIKDGIKQELQRDFAVRVNAYMGVDAVVGKAQRKLYAAVLNQLSGIVTLDGEIDDSIPISAEVTPIAVKPAVVEKPASSKPREEMNMPQTEATQANSPVEKKEPELSTLAQKVRGKLAESGISEERFLRQLVEVRLVEPAIAAKGLGLVPDRSLRIALNDWQDIEATCR
jgi:hypothetical protein